MQIPKDLESMYEFCLNASARETERIPVSPEYIMAIIERVADLELELSRQQENWRRERSQVQSNLAD